MADINVTGLQMALDLDTSGANRAMEDLTSSATSLEQQFTQSIQEVFGEVEKSYADIASNLQDIGKYTSMNVRDITKEVEELQKMKDISDELDQFQQDETKFFKDVLKDYDKLIKSITDKNKLHKSENDLVDQEKQLSQSINDSLGRRVTQQEYNRILINETVRAVKELYKFMIMTDQAAEAFVTSNYRAYDSQNQLAQEVRLTAAAYGLLLDHATEAMALAGAMAVQRGELERYTKVIAQTTRFTGLATKSIADHAFQMRQVGMNAEGAEKHFAKLSEQMRKYKLSTEDLNKAMEGTTWTPAETEFFLGEGAAEEMVHIRAALIGIGKESGVTADQMMDFSKMFESSIDNMVMWERVAGRSIDSTDDVVLAIRRQVEAAKQLVKAREGGLVEKKVLLEAEAATRGLTSSQITMLATLNEAKLAQLAHASATGEAANMAEEYRVANQTLTQSVKMLTSTLFALLSWALEPVRYALALLTIWVEKLISGVIKTLKPIADWWNELQKTHEWVGSVAKTIKFLIGIIASFVFVVISVKKALAGMRLVMGGITTISPPFQKSVVGVGKSFGKALAAMTKGVPVILAVGAGLLMAGGGAYLFAKAIEVVMDAMNRGDEATRRFWHAVLGLSAAMAIMITVVVAGMIALSATSTALAPTIPFVLLFVGAILALGAAAMMAGKGLEWAGKGMKAIGEGVREAGKGIGELSKGLIALTVAGPSWATFAKLAAGLTSIAYAAEDAAPSMSKIGDVLGQLFSAQMTQFADGMMALAGILTTLQDTGIDGLRGFVDNAIDLVNKLDNIGPILADMSAKLAVTGAVMQLVQPYFDAIGQSLEQMSKALTTLQAQSAELGVIGDRMLLFAQKVWISGRMLRASFSSFGWLSLINLVSFLDFMATALIVSTWKLNAAADAFAEPTDKISNSLINLATAIVGFDTLGDRFADNMEALVAPLNRYAAELEGASERIDAAINKKMLPAVKAAQEANLKEALKSEAITNIEIFSPKEDANQKQMITLLQQQNTILATIGEAMGGLSADELKRIREAIENKESVARNEVPGLNSDLTGWT